MSPYICLSRGLDFFWFDLLVSTSLPTASFVFLIAVFSPSLHKSPDPRHYNKRMVAPYVLDFAHTPKLSLNLMTGPAPRAIEPPAKSKV